MMRIVSQSNMIETTCPLSALPGIKFLIPWLYKIFLQVPRGPEILLIPKEKDTFLHLFFPVKTLKGYQQVIDYSGVQSIITPLNF